MCDQVAERVALGESLGELAGHTESCTSCQDLVAMSSKLGGTHHAVDPGLGFTARMTVGAQHRIAARRRQRLAAGLAASVAAGAFGVFAVTRTPDHQGPAIAMPKVPVRSEPPTDKNKNPDDNDPSPTAEEADLAALVELADVDRSRHLSARWAHIKKPLAPYKKLIAFKGVTP
jgi:hypothetical protein